MRNLKRVLSTIMAVAMLMSLVVFSASANTAFTDDEKIVNTEAVDMNVALKIINGYEDGSFKPEGNITRAEMCKMIAVLMHGGLDPVLGTKPYDASFTDIRGHWAEKYIEYCVAEGIVAGMGDGTFQPDGNVTGTQAAKMLLVALGFRADVEQFNTSNWATRINVCAAGKHLYDGVSATDPNAPLSRDNAAQMIWNALQANEVEYTNEWYMTESGAMATKLVARDRTQAGGATGTTAFISLLEDKYECTTYTGLLTHTSWDKANKVFKYDIEGLSYLSGIKLAEGAAWPSPQSTIDYSDLFAMNVKIVVKKDNKTLLGMVRNNSVVLAEGIVDDIESVSGELAIKLDGTKYRADNGAMLTGNMNSVYAFGQNNFEDIMDLDDFFADNGDEDFGLSDAVLGNADVAWNVKLIDVNGNGKFEYAVYTPFYVAQVNYLTDASVSFVPGGVELNRPSGADAERHLGFSGSLDFATSKIYEGIAKDDYVVIYPDVNTPYEQEVVVKMETVSGEVNRIVRNAVPQDTKWYVEGTSYQVHADARDNLDGTALIGNVYDVYQINGFIFGQDLNKSNFTMDDVLMVYAFEEAGGNVSNAQAKVYFAKDGSNDVVSIKELYIQDNNGNLDEDNNVMRDLDDDNALVLYKLFTFTEKNGNYVLKEVCEDNTVGFRDYVAGGDGISASTSRKAGTLDGTTIGDEAVVFVVYSSNGATLNKVKVLTGKAAANMSDTFGDYSDYLSNKVGNVNTVQLGVVVADMNERDGGLPSTGELGNFGFIVSDVGTVKISGTTYTNFKIFTKDGTKEVNWEGRHDAARGQVISYSDAGDGEIEDVVVLSKKDVEDAPEDGDFATIGAVVGRNGKAIEFQYNDAATGLRTTTIDWADADKAYGQLTYDSDTVFMVVDTASPAKGISVTVGDGNVLRAKVLNEGNYQDNCVFVTDSAGVLKLVVMDQNGSWNGGWDLINNVALHAKPVVKAGVDTLTLTSVAPAGGASAAWEVELAADDTEVTITAKAADKNRDAFTVANSGAGNVVQTPDTDNYVVTVDQTDVITITVLADDGITTATYTITFVDPNP